MSCIIGEIGNDLESDPQTLSTKVLMEILSREKNQGRTDRSTENFIGDRRIIAISVFLAMMTEPARKTSLENKHLRNCDCFAIIPSCSHFTILTKNPATGFV